MTPTTFPDSARLLRPAEYVNALKGKRVARGRLLTVSASRTSTGQPRLGLVVAKRFARRAVSRNTIKRVIREAFRLRRHELLPYDYVFRVHSPVPQVSLRQLKSMVRTETHALLDRLTP